MAASLFEDLRKHTGVSGETREKLVQAARIAIGESLAVREGEQVLIVTNPSPDVFRIAEALYDAALERGGRPVLMYQGIKTQFDFADPAVIAAFGSKPEVFISMSAEKLGKDAGAIASPYEYEGKHYDSIFHLQMYGEKTCRAFWSPSTTLESFIRTVPIDYALLRTRCAAVKKILAAAAAVRITAPSGTDILIPLQGRRAFSDDGDFSRGGSGGNLPAGETFVSPALGGAEGVIVYDGSICLAQGTLVIRTPIRCTVEGGFVTRVEGGEEARALLETITGAEHNAADFEKTGKLPPGAGPVYARNARNIGELGIGLNPEARITGSMLEDEKAFSTCHFAIGSNYDEDAPSLIHLDGLVKDPTITARLPDGHEIPIEVEGRLIGA
jgi:leucyl aminopeptidase (aminopeptidase T)